MPILNGEPVPVELPLPELARMLDSPDMTGFALACRALSLRKTPDCYTLLRNRFPHRDPYRHRCLLEALYVFPQSAELADYVAQALLSRQEYLVCTALQGIIRGHFTATDALLLTALDQNLDYIVGNYFQVLNYLEKTDENFQAILSMFRRSSGQQRAAIARELSYWATSENCQVLFDLLCNEPSSQIRLVGIRIANEFGRSDLLHSHKDDPDGHIRKLIAKGADNP